MTQICNQRDRNVLKELDGLFSLHTPSNAVLNSRSIFFRLFCLFINLCDLDLVLQYSAGAISFALLPKNSSKGIVERGREA